MVVFLIIVGIEQIVKQIFKRPRPYEINPGIAMLQPINPHDASFPSGDALRVWYLALILPILVGNSSLFLAGTIILAVFVTLGRIVMGVHYLTDTLAGTGLGMLGAGATLWLWHLLDLI
jgi:undecaprenyl-diphosphatase